MIKNRAPHKRQAKPMRLTAKHREYYAKPRTDADIVEDTKEIYAFLTHILLGAYIEPGRDREKWVRRCMRDALAAGTLRRVHSREVVWNAQHKENAFAWLLNYWLRFDFTKAEGEGESMHRLGDRVVFVDYDKPIVSNV